MQRGCTMKALLFLSTLSLRRATVDHSTITFAQIFLSTLSLRRATDYDGLKKMFDTISIHALLAESDHGSAETGIRG